MPQSLVMRKKMIYKKKRGLLKRASDFVKGKVSVKFEDGDSKMMTAKELKKYKGS